jgi:hypothetical protein
MTDWDGQTIDGITFDYSTPENRTATKGAIVEQHVVVRPWYVGEIILAVNQVTGGTDATDDALKDILWEDTNQAAHAWAMVDINDTGGITPESLNVRSVSALAPIKSTGGTRPVISLLPSGVTPGTYGSVTVDAHGLVTAGGAGTGGTTINPTDTYLPVRADATTFEDSFLYIGNPYSLVMATPSANTPSFSIAPLLTSVLSGFYRVTLKDDDGVADAIWINGTKDSGWGVSTPSARNAAFSVNVLHQNAMAERFEINGSGPFYFFSADGVDLVFELAAGNTICGVQAPLATTDTDGFLHIPTCAGPPTGTPNLYTGKVPIVYDTVTPKLWVYTGGSWV